MRRFTRKQNLQWWIKGIERVYVEQALMLADGIRKNAAVWLGVSERVMRHLEQRHDLGQRRRDIRATRSL